MTTAVLVWGTQLTVEHNTALAAEPDAPVIVIESAPLCRARRYHQQKLAFLLGAMRHHVDALRASGREVLHIPLEDSGSSYRSDLDGLLDGLGCLRLVAMQTADRRPTVLLQRWCADRGTDLEVLPDGMFLTSEQEFASWAGNQKRLQFEQFYRWQRRRLGILMEGAEPLGGRWNFDHSNRKPLPKDYRVPPRQWPEQGPRDAEVRALVRERFADHPGNLDTWWLPTTREGSLQLLADFVANHLVVFGDYEDAMRPGESFVHHSVLSPALNAGLLHPNEVVDAVLDADAPLTSVEGFVRQVIGWREFVHGTYRHFPATWKDSNALDLHEPLPAWAWSLEGAPEPPLAGVLATLRTYGWNHHIERLMVLGNWFLLHDHDPAEVLDWFSAMYVDAYEWVMVPNVIGMSQYADGGLDAGGFASKPYISGSAYLQRMGRWWPTAAAAKASAWTPAYWEFLSRHRDKLAGNHRLAPALRQAGARGGSPSPAPTDR